ncbi:hypothetical protein NLX71_18255 [Paenibacillus sp. MZ04-78.2]|uniref:hypothetical protein n=1 Tax=Paenibacillus sp. MZ04-78.2 TaxID=2962034 RepID=UPI0020B7946A|nr:hypothetical protein [Paenibacillus sp. MZ04-78.2]MCP3775217.1 hypothetical protein [Paenibacillus sp. MZ04-78.2]
MSFVAKNHFVAFIDLLGFSSMVKKDLEAPDGTNKYMEELFRVHQETIQLAGGVINLDVVQFSDSVILATEFKKENFNEFLWLITKYQFTLFSRGILSRGGVAYGKHYYNNGFLYSLGLIEAYNIESKIAKNPRVIVSSDLLELLYENEEAMVTSKLPLIKENDGLLFLDYLSFCEDGIELFLDTITRGLENGDPKVREKYNWLSDYIKYKFPEANLSNNRFK